MEKILPTRLIEKSDSPYPLTYELRDLDNLTYNYKGKKYTIDDYIQTFKVAGLIVIRDGKILYESYNFGNNENLDGFHSLLLNQLLLCFLERRLKTDI